MIKIRPTPPPVRVVTTPDTSKVFHEHTALEKARTNSSGWVELLQTDGRYVCPHCNWTEAAGRR